MTMAFEDQHDPDCSIIAAGWNGDMNGRCNCVRGARAELAYREATAASKASAVAAARKPIDDAYARGRADERADWERRLKALEERLAMVERKASR